MELSQDRTLADTAPCHHRVSPGVDALPGRSPPVLGTFGHKELASRGVPIEQPLHPGQGQQPGSQWPKAQRQANLLATLQHHHLLQHLNMTSMLGFYL